jgi:membrane fusion protein, heavy metal efflux system
MSSQTSYRTKIATVLRWAGNSLVGIVSAIGLVGLAALLFMAVVHHLAPPAPPPDNAAVHLVPGSHDALKLSPSVIEALAIFAVPARPAGSRDQLQLLGSLFIDPGHMSRVHSRFPGEVVSIGTLAPAAAGSQSPPGRALRVGDHVAKGQLLAIVWSKDIGEKKSDLVGALSQLARDELQLKRLQSLEPGVVPLKDVREAQQRREADMVSVKDAERTLRSWRLTQEEIDAARAEAEKIHKGQPADASMDQHWAEVEIRSPFDGVILERNATLGDIVTTDLDLFKVADLSKLGVLVNAFEEDLPSLEALSPEARQWTVHLKSQPRAAGMIGYFEAIGKVVEPVQHTATVMGWVDNRRGQLRVGQFVTASVDLPARADEVVIPKSALIEQGNSAVVFVATDAATERVERRRVSVARRTRDQIFVDSRPSAVSAAAGCKPLAVGELVITSGTVELAGALRNALAALPPEDSAPK